MTFKALVESFQDHDHFPILVDDILAWIKNNTDHKDITLHSVKRDNKAFRGGFRRRAVTKPNSQMYSSEYEIITQIFYGSDLEPQWQRLVIVKEALHVFDGNGACVDNVEKLRLLIPAIMAKEIQDVPFFPAMNDKFGAYKAMSILLPEKSRLIMANAVENGSRTVEEVANFTKLPETYVDIWLRFGAEIADAISKLTDIG